MVNAPFEIPLSTGLLRRMIPIDLNAFAEMNADFRVMEFFPSPWSFEESRAAFERINDEFAGRGFGVYAMEHTEEFAGIVGLWVPSFEAYFTPTVEILWRLAPRFWGRGLATEAAQAVLDMAFKVLNLPEVVAFTAPQNQRSIRVMERLRMKRDAEPFFDHPGVSDDRLRRHVLYRATATVKPTAKYLFQGNESGDTLD